MTYGSESECAIHYTTAPLLYCPSVYRTPCESMQPFRKYNAWNIARPTRCKKHKYESIPKHVLRLPSMHLDEQIFRWKFRSEQLCSRALSFESPIFHVCFSFSTLNEGMKMEGSFCCRWEVRTCMLSQYLSIEVKWISREVLLHKSTECSPKTLFFKPNQTIEELTYQVS